MNFSNRIVNIWNGLSNAVVDVDFADLFKSRLDNFWMSQDVKTATVRSASLALECRTACRLTSMW